MEGPAVKDRIPSPTGTGSGRTPPWSGEAAAASLRRFVEKGQIEPGRALVLSAGMGEEIAALHDLGFRVVALDEDAAALKRLGGARQGNGNSVIPVRGEFLAMSPSYCGPVEMVVDRIFVHGLEPARRADWIHKTSRILPRGGRLVGFFLVGRSPEGPPYPIALDALKKLVGRHFITEVLEPTGTAEPGRGQAYRGLFLRK
jgi:hypothetical protein